MSENVAVTGGSLLERAASAFEEKQAGIDEYDEQVAVKAVAELERTLGDVEITGVSAKDKRILVQDGDKTFLTGYKYNGEWFVFHVLDRCHICGRMVAGDTFIHDLASFYEAVAKWQPGYYHLKKHKVEAEKKWVGRLYGNVRRYVDGDVEDAEKGFQAALVSALALIYEQLVVLSEAQE